MKLKNLRISHFCTEFSNKRKKQTIYIKFSNIQIKKEPSFWLQMKTENHTILENSKNHKPKTPFSFKFFLHFSATKQKGHWNLKRNKHSHPENAITIKYQIIRFWVKKRSITGTLLRVIACLRFEGAEECQQIEMGLVRNRERERETEVGA